MATLRVQVMGGGVTEVHVPVDDDGISAADLKKYLEKELGPSWRSCSLLVDGRSADYLAGQKITRGEVVAALRQVMGAATATTPFSGAQEDASDRWVSSVCHLCVYGQCATLWHVKDGVALKVEGNPEAPHNQGRLCPRGNSAIMELYDPYRVKVPLKRTNPEKGLDIDPGFVEITWDEALNIVAEKLKAVRESDPREFHSSGGMADSPLAGGFQMFLGGAPMHFFAGVAACGSSEHAVSTWSHNGHVSGFDPDYTEMLILQGTNAGFGTWLGGAAGGSVQRVADARIERGLKIVVIDPRCSEGGNKANEWIPIVPGTDLAFNLSMLNVILHELNRFDVEFVKKHTNGPYLIQPNGYYMKNEDGKPLVWDPIAGEARAFDDPGVEDVALEGLFEVDGEPCRPAFNLLKDRVRPYTPEWQQEVTSVPPSTVRRLASDFVRSAKIGATIKVDGVEFPYRPAAMIGYHGSTRHYNGPYTTMALQLINALVGNFDVPGGKKGMPEIAAHPEIYDMPAPKDGMLEFIPPSEISFPPDPDLKQFYPLAVDTHVAWLNWTLTDQAMKDKFKIPYGLKALCLGGTNPFRNMGDNAGTEKMLRSIDFIFTVSIYIDEPALFADVVLPEDVAAERLEAQPYYAMFQIGLKGTQLRQPIVGRLYDTKHRDEISMEIAERMGILYGEGGYIDFLNKTLVGASAHMAGKPTAGPPRLDINQKPRLAEYVDASLRATYGDERGLEWFRSNAFLFQKMPVEKDYHWAPLSGRRFPIYYEPVKELGDLLKQRIKDEYGWDWDTSWYDSLPRWEPCPEHDNSRFPPDMDMYIINYKTPYNTNSQTASNAWLAELYEADPYFLRAWMNAETGRKKGLQDGDVVIIESLAGKAEARVKLSQRVHPSVIAIGGAQGSKATNPFAMKGINYASLLPQGPDQINPMLCNLDWCTRVRITKVEEQRRRRRG